MRQIRLLFASLVVLLLIFPGRVFAGCSTTFYGGTDCSNRLTYRCWTNGNWAYETWTCPDGGGAQNTQCDTGPEARAVCGSSSNPTCQERGGGCSMTPGGFWPARLESGNSFRCYDNNGCTWRPGAQYSHNEECAPNWVLNNCDGVWVHDICESRTDSASCASATGWANWGSCRWFTDAECGPEYRNCGNWQGVQNLCPTGNIAACSSGGLCQNICNDTIQACPCTDNRTTAQVCAANGVTCGNTLNNCLQLTNCGACPAKTCTVLPASTSINVGQTATVTYSGNNNNNTIPSDNVELLITSQTSGQTITPAPAAGSDVITDGTRTYYRVSSGTSTGNTAYNAGSYTTLNTLPAGNYYLFCRLPSAPAACSGNPFCSANGGPLTTCTMSSCSNSDFATLRVCGPIAPTVSLTSPANGATGVNRYTSLSWATNYGMACPSNSNSQTLYFGTDSLNPQICGPGNTYCSSNPVGQNYSPQNLAYGAHYYWRVVVNNGSQTASSPIWNFWTAPQAFWQVVGGNVYGSNITSNIPVTLPACQRYINTNN